MEEGTNNLSEWFLRQASMSAEPRKEEDAEGMMGEEGEEEGEEGGMGEEAGEGMGEGIRTSARVSSFVMVLAIEQAQHYIAEHSCAIK